MRQYHIARDLKIKSEVMLDILEQSKNQKKFIGIWLYGSEDGFWSGIVKNYTDELVTLQHYTKYGKPDGLVIEKISNIESIDFDDDYSRAMSYLIRHGDELDLIEKYEIEITNNDRWQQEILGNLIGSNELIVRIQVNGENFYCGLVEWADEDHLILKVIGKEGQEQGKSIYKIEDITAIRVNDLDNRKRLLLYHWRQSKKTNPET